MPRRLLFEFKPLGIAFTNRNFIKVALTNLMSRCLKLLRLVLPIWGYLCKRKTRVDQIIKALVSWNRHDNLHFPRKVECKAGHFLRFCLSTVSQQGDGNTSYL